MGLALILVEEPIPKGEARFLVELNPFWKEVLSCTNTDQPMHMHPQIALVLSVFFCVFFSLIVHKIFIQLKHGTVEM